MPGFNMKLSLDDSRLRLGRESLQRVAGNLRPMMIIAGGIFENSTRSRFDMERGPGGIPWPRSWRAQVQGGKTLTDTGLLRGSIRSNVGNDFVETGVDGRNLSARYAKSHQFGVTIRPVKAKALLFTGPDGRFHAAKQVTLPARPFIGIDADDVEDLRDAFVVYLGGSFNGNRGN